VAIPIDSKRAPEPWKRIPTSLRIGIGGFRDFASSITGISDQQDFSGIGQFQQYSSPYADK